MNQPITGLPHALDVDPSIALGIVKADEEPCEIGFSAGPSARTCRNGATAGGTFLPCKGYPRIPRKAKPWLSVARGAVRHRAAAVAQFRFAGSLGARNPEPLPGFIDSSLPPIDFARRSILTSIMKLKV